MTGRNCQAVILFDSHFTHTIERDRERDIEKGQGIKEIHKFWRLVRDGNGLQFLFCFLASVGGDRSTKIYFVLSVTVTPDPQAFQSLTSIAACSESGRIQRQPIHPWLRADWRPSVRRSEPTLTSADWPEDVRRDNITAQQHGNAKLQKKVQFISLLRKIIRNPTWSYY